MTPETKARLAIEAIVLLLLFLFVQGEITRLENKIDALPERIIEAEAEHKRAQAWFDEHYPNGFPGTDLPGVALLKPNNSNDK